MIKVSVKDKMMAPKVIFTVLAVALIAGAVNALPPQKLVGASPAAPGEFPYQASLRVRGQHICGGAIVSKRHILTAAHCVASLTEGITVATGSISSSGGTVHKVQQILFNKQYNTRDVRSTYDIAVITLSNDITFDKNQNKIALATSAPAAGVTATATGWGYVSASVPRITPSLNKVQLKVISGIQCQQMFGNMGTIYTNQVCTYSGRGIGTCQGDSGGPLVANNQLIGLVSYGQPCAVGFPDVFSSISENLAWINSIVNP